MHVAELNGITISYHDEGEGVPVVLIHGHPFDGTMWGPQMGILGQSGYRVVVPDLRGYGRTTVVPGATAIDVFAADIVALLDYLELDRVVLAGLSMGGQIVMEFARLFPRRTMGLVLADTTAKAETSGSRRDRYEMADRLVAEGMGRYSVEVLPMMLSANTIASRPAIAEHVLSMMGGTPPDGAAAALRGRAERPDYTETLSSLDVPVLILVGSEDEFTPIDDSQLMHELIEDSELVTIDGVAHLPNLEREDEFNRALVRFLDRFQPRGIDSA